MDVLQKSLTLHHVVFVTEKKITIDCLEGQDCTAQFDICDFLTCTTDPCELSNRKISMVSDMKPGYLITIASTTDWTHKYKPDFPRNPTLPKRLTIRSPKLNPHCNAVILTLKSPAPDNSTFILWLLKSVGELTAKFSLYVHSRPPSRNGSIVKYFEELSQVISLETSADIGANLWLKWVQYTTKTMTNKNCFACASARPQLTTAPAPYNNDTDMICMLKLFTYKTFDSTDECCHLDKVFVVVTSKDVPLNWAVGHTKYTCFESRTHTNPDKQFGDFTDLHCNKTLMSEPYADLFHQSLARAAIWCLCADLRLHAMLPKIWTGKCTLAMLIIYLLIYLLMHFPLLMTLNYLIIHMILNYTKSRKDLYIYLNAVNTPCCVPDEYKAQDEVLAGLASILFSWVTSNKNVVYALCLVLSVALTFPVTAPDGSVTKALLKLQKFVYELSENSGIPNNSWSAWFYRIVGPWTGTIASLFTTIMIIIAVLIIIGCCVVSCLRNLIERLITTAIAKQRPHTQLLHLTETDTSSYLPLELLDLSLRHGMFYLEL
uniref:Uncharacterized protein n=1 Tax=Periophthalmus magnuspinnatus TaxID=409849 RepID=A0A3B4BD11_9GOBI